VAPRSAVTISGGGRVKIFDTADKLFELSEEHPIGVMINGNMDCLGLPWEILVKDFRQNEGRKPRPSVAAWGKDFLQYVESHVLISETAIGGYIDNVTNKEIDAIQERVGRRLRDHIFQTAVDEKAKKKMMINIQQWLVETIAQRKEFLSGFPIANSLADLVHAEVTKHYSSRIRELLVEKFTGQELTNEELVALTDVVVKALLRSHRSAFAAGVVIAGYGTDETFPAVFTAEVDGKVCGKLKITDVTSNTIADSKDGGQVTSFAQTDVIQRLLTGVDPQFVSKTGEFIERAVTQVGETIEQATRRKKMSQKKIEDRLKLIREVAQTVTDEYTTKTAETLKNGFSREFDRMIAMMPKQEIIEFAEALVSITAVERKATSDEGTVGGPIDVWPAPGSEDTELGVLMELEVGHGETEVYARVQA
jgi:hypothetical protein